MNEDMLREYVSCLLAEDLVRVDAYDQKKQGEGWFEKFLSFFRKDKKQAKKVAEYFIDDFEERNLIDLPGMLKQRIYNFCEKKFPFAMKKANGDEDRATTILFRAINNVFFYDLRKLKYNTLSNHDDDMI